MMKAKKTIWASLAVIVLCLSLIGGATFALFTSESPTNIAVNAGKVKYEATATLAEAWSAKWDKESNIYNYPQVELSGNTATFTNGGTVSYDEDKNLFTLDKITPGDGVKVNINIKNYSNVKTRYRVEITAKDNGLIKGLDISYKMGEKTLGSEDENPLVSEWTEVETIPADPEAGEDLGTIEVKIELPIGANNDYQEKSCDIAINVFAVQFNGHIEDAALHSTLMTNILNAAEEKNIQSSAIIFGSWEQYKDVVGGSYDDGTAVSGDAISAKMFYVENDKAEGGSAIYVLARMGISAADEASATLTFADTDFTYVDLSGVDFSRTTTIDNMFKDSNIETLILSGVDLSKVTDLNNMFKGATALKSVDFSDANLSGNGVSRYSLFAIANETPAGLTSLKDLFKDCKALEEINFSGADLSGVETLESAFANNTTLQQVNFSGADLHNVTSTSGMFYKCTSLNKVDFSNADISSAEHIQMFYDSSISEVDFSGANLSGLTTLGYYDNGEGNYSSGSSPFYGATSLKTVNFSGANLSNLESMYMMFQNTAIETFVFSDVFGGCDLSNVWRMSHFFYKCTSLSEVDFSGANLPNVTDMSNMFYGCTGLTTFVYSDIFGEAYLPKLEDASNFLDGCTNIKDVDLTGAPAPSVKNLNNFFKNWTKLESFSFSKYFGDADFSGVSSMQSMFEGCTSLKSVDFSDADLSNVTNMSYMFEGCTALNTVHFSENNIFGEVDMSWMFNGCTALTSFSFSEAFPGSDFSAGVNFDHMFKSSAIQDADFSGVNLKITRDPSTLFYACSSLEKVNFSGVDFSGITSLTMLKGRSSLKVANFSGANLSGLKDEYDSANSRYVSQIGLGTTNKGSTMFRDCISLEEINFSGANLSGLVSLRGAYSGNYSGTSAIGSGLTTLKKVNFSGAVLSNVTELGGPYSRDGMFYQCSSLSEVDFSGAILPTLTNAANMFYQCSSLDTVYLWRNEDLINLSDASKMFYNCSKIRHIYVDADIDLSATLTDASGMWYMCQYLPNIGSKFGSSSNNLPELAKTGDGGCFEVAPQKA